MAMIRRTQRSRGRTEAEHHIDNMATTTALLSEEEPDLEIGEDSRLLSSPDDEPLGEVQVR